MPTSGLSGSAPNIFICFASSHCVGGEEGSETVEADGEVGRLSQEKGTREIDALSFRAMLVIDYDDAQPAKRVHT